MDNKVKVAIGIVVILIILVIVYFVFFKKEETLYDRWMAIPPETEVTSTPSEGFEAINMGVGEVNGKRFTHKEFSDEIKQNAYGLNKETSSPTYFKLTNTAGETTHFTLKSDNPLVIEVSGDTVPEKVDLTYSV